MIAIYELILSALIITGTKISVNQWKNAQRSLKELNEANSGKVNFPPFFDIPCYCPDCAGLTVSERAEKVVKKKEEFSRSIVKGANRKASENLSFALYYSAATVLAVLFMLHLIFNI